MSKFVSLHNHSHFSILQALPSPKELFCRAKELNQPAIALTDSGSFAGAWDAFKASKETGVKLIIGAEFYFLPDASKKEDKIRHIILLAKDAIGYKNLLTLNRVGFDQALIAGRKVLPIVDWKTLENYSKGVICLTACGNGIIGHHINSKNFDAAETDIKRLITIFGKDDLGIEVQPNALNRPSTPYHSNINQIFTNYHLIRLANKFNLRIVPTCNAHFLKKEEADTHDVLLAIGAMQPRYSNARLRYNVPDFYLKSYEEIKTFFARNFGEEFADKICENTIYFANKCEMPDWIEPRFSNPRGKELPVFDVRGAEDYQEFENWIKEQSGEIRSLSEDTAYLRFKCYSVFNRQIAPKLTFLKCKEYIERIEKELTVLDKQGFSSYMLIVADYVSWARKNNISVGPGRGCNFFNTQVLTNSGFKNLGDISVSDKVYTHTGQLQKVINTQIYDINEELLEVFTTDAYKKLIMTLDHKVLAYRAEETDEYKYAQIHHKTNKVRRFKRIKENPEWIECKDLKVNDYIYTKFPIRKSTTQPADVDLARWAPNKFIKISITDDKIYYKSTSDINPLSINRYIKYDNDFMYFLGRFVGDGWFAKRNNIYNHYTVGIAFDLLDVNGKEWMMNYLSKLGYKPKFLKHKKKRVGQVIVSNILLYGYLQNLFLDYLQTPETKHLPTFFRYIKKDLLVSMLNGLSDADGSINGNRESIDTVSLRLALEIKEALLFLKIPSTISIRKAFIRKIKNKKYNCKESYKIRFRGLNTKPNNKYIKEYGYFSPILSISNNKNYDKVYDIEVENDHSYLTTNGIVHNSVGGSIIGYLLNVHKADPIKYGLIFERFQNIERINPPDVDLDFGTSGRDKVLSYIQSKYGQDKVAFISNFSRITPKVYSRDLARSLEFGNDRKKAVDIGNNIADTISKELKNSLKFNELKKSPLFMEYVKRYPELEKNADILGKFRNYSTHAAALLIGNRPLVGLVPLRKDKDGNQTIEYEKNNSEENGLLKVDILGLSTLDLIDHTIELINKTRDIKIKVGDINFEDYDKKTYDLISRGDTFGVFQFGTSAGTIDLCKKIKPKSIDDLAIITTLARPAATLIREDFIKIKEGKQKFEILHPSVKVALEKTYGFMLYDEAMLQLGEDVAGWSLNESDRIRKMIKSKGQNPEKDKKLRQDFIDSAVMNGIERNMATKIWDERISSAGSYTFNRSHAILYSFISYITAYLKAHYPIEFLLANLIAEVKSNAPDAENNIDRAKMELRQCKVKILPPDINKSAMDYQLLDNHTLLTGLDALKFVGEDAIQDILEKRPFTSFDDFMLRTDTRKVRSSAIQALAAAGCMDSFGIPRKLIYLYCSDYRKKLQVWLKKHDPKTETFSFPWTTEEEWSKPELYALEKHYLGESFVCSKKEAFGNFFKDNTHANMSTIKLSRNKTFLASVKAEIKSVFELKVKKENSRLLGQEMAKVILEDEFGVQCNLTIFPERWNDIKKKIKQSKSKLSFDPGFAIHFAGSCNLYENDMGIILDTLYELIPPPTLPKDLKAKRMAIKNTETTKPSKVAEASEVSDLVQQIEDELFTEGLVDLDEDPFSLDI